MRFVLVRRALAAMPVLLAIVLPVVNCGGKGSPAVQSGTVAFIEQPTSVAVPIGRTATFTADATTLPSLNPVYPITYQWTKNGVAIPGATGTSYTTPTVALADNGTQYQVTASSGSNSLGSSVVTLTAGPRAPAIGDVRYLLFQQVTGPWPLDANTGVLPNEPEEVFNALGTPLPMTQQGECGWQFSYQYVPTSMNGQFDMYYQANGDYQTWLAYLNSLGQGNIVFISADLEPCVGIAVAYIQVQAAGFDYQLDEFPAAQVSAAIANYGNESRIVTAVTYDSTAGEWVLISYGWQGDTTTVYESQVATIPAGSQDQTGPQVWSAAQTLASQGYFISAFGGNYADGYLMVGMRVQGDTMPRPIYGYTQDNPPANADDAYWTAVVWEYPTSVMEQ